MTDTILRALRTYGLTLPGTHLKSPWPGHKDLAVKDKTFAYLSIDGEPFSISVKLARSHEVAMLIPGAVPTAYGLGKSGWVTMKFAGDVPEDLLREWIEESYRLQAPKKLVALLTAALSSSPPPTAPTATKKTSKTSTKKTATKKTATKKAATKKTATKT